MTIRSYLASLSFLLFTVLLALHAPLFAFDLKNWQWQPLSFEGGLNIESAALQCPANQLVSVDNFVWRKDHIEGRQGKWRLQQPLTAASVRYITTFKTSHGAMYLFYSDGSHLWYSAGLQGTPVELTLGRCNSGTFDSYASNKFVHGNTIASQKWRTMLGSGEGATMTVGDRTRTISKVLLDTLILLTADMDTAYAAGTYNIDWSEVDITGMLPVNDSLWIYSSIGKYYFASSDNFVTVDSFAASRYAMSTPFDSLFCQDPYGAVLRFTSNSGLYSGVGKYLRLVTNPKAFGTNPLPTNHAMYLSYPIVAADGAGNVRTRASAFRPKNEAQYFSVETLVYDSTTKYAVMLDSIIRVPIAFAGNGCSNDSAYYLKLFCDTCDWQDDTLRFGTGDWFMAPQDVGRTFGADTGGRHFTTYIQYGYCFPVVGGFVNGADSTIYTVGDNWLATDHDTCAVLFFRMKRQITDDSVGINFATIYQQSVFEVRARENDRVYFSQPNLPDDFTAGDYIIIEYGKPIMGGGQQAGELILYTKDSRWKVYPANGTFYSERMNGSRGLVSKNSFVNIDNIHYGLAADGYWQCDGSTPILISGAVSSYFTDSINTSRYDLVTAAWDAENDDIWISFPRRSATKNGITLVYHRPGQSWWRQTGASGAFCYVGDRDFSDSVRMITGGTDSTTIYAIGGRTDDTVAISGTLRTGYMDFGDKDNAKSIKSLLFNYYAPATTSLRWELYRLKSGASSQVDTASFSISAYSAIKQVYVDQSKTWGRTMQFGVTVPSVSGVWINAYDVLAVLRGRIR